MWKISKMLAITLAIVTGGIIGYTNTNSNNLQANEVTKIRWVDVPKTDVSLPSVIDIDLQEDKVYFSGNTENATVRIEKEIVEVPKYVTKEKEVYVPVVDRSWSNKLLDRVAPLEIQKLNY